MKKVELRQWERYFEARNTGIGVEAAAKRARISPATAYRFERGDQASSGLEAASILGLTTVAGNLLDQPLSPEAQLALEDFSVFRLRYFGRRSTPWQTRAAYDVLRALSTDDREYVVTNCPPGSGKSTLFTHDIPCWLIAKDRTIRIQVGSRTERQARMYVGRIKKSLERDAPMRAGADEISLGVATDAVATLQDDFGAFRPEGRSELWRAEALVVRQTDGVSLDDKEPTCSAWGQDSGFLGGRFDLVIWDDLVDRKNSKTTEARDSLIEWWGTEAETRLEPGGALILQGQRIGAFDLYKHALSQKNLDETPKYRHIKYQAHDEDRCTGEHGKDAPPWPDGCLLDPHRLPWSMLQTLKVNSPRVYDVQYQQEDGSSVGGLVDPAWITGDVDTDGYPAPGCLDRKRSLGVVPPHLTDGNGWSFVTVDPSPTQWWGVIWWIYDPATNNRYIIDVVRRRLSAPQFLSLDMTSFEYSGVAEDIRRRSNDLGAPIQMVMVEVNAAQRWLLQQPHIQEWVKATGVTFVPHTTTVNKSDPKYGVESIADYFRQGRVRIPWDGPMTRAKIEPLISELQNYPDGETTDLVMSTWFHTLAVNNHFARTRRAPYQRDVPGFVSGIPSGRPVSRGLSYAR
ncbi:MAG TPA: hypothetical protein VLS51_00220 [Propionibacteriaceae bacterium]|nr:hypothetical protein [Propionibacteriaceae bacterium]